MTSEIDVVVNGIGGAATMLLFSVGGGGVKKVYKQRETYIMCRRHCTEALVFVSSGGLCGDRIRDAFYFFRGLSGTAVGQG